jgi:hypothetical protein
MGKTSSLQVFIALPERSAATRLDQLRSSSCFPIRMTETETVTKIYACCVDGCSDVFTVWGDARRHMKACGYPAKPDMRTRRGGL